ncbi:MAG TPA: methionyl-tRNA formyltransferase [Solirubrobacterales bacterium]|nr:methionyl-tRNA formyltransferase [Solirubrobacterales bacterium]
MRVAYLGTSTFAVTVLRRLADSPHRPALVVTPPDRPRGRGRRLASPPVAEAASELGLSVLQTESVNLPEAAEGVRAARPDLGVVCAFGQLIKDPLLSELEMLNVHPSLLPRWRGAAPIERAIMAADEGTGISIIKVTAGLDSGPIALQEPVAIDERDDFGSLSARLAQLAGELIVRTLDLRKAGTLQLSEQDDSSATYAEKISTDERRLDPGRPAAELERTVRALNPHIRAYLELDGGERLGVRAAAAEAGGDLEPRRLAASDGTLRLGCAEGALRLDVVQPQGKRPMAADAYLRGHALPSLAR